MAKPKPKPKPKPPKVRNRPFDYLRGGRYVGEKYTAWDTYGQGRPDFGKGAGPGEPYREIIKTNSKAPRPPKQTQLSPPVGLPQRPPQGGSGGKFHRDARIAAIRKRLGWS